MRRKLEAQSKQGLLEKELKYQLNKSDYLKLLIVCERHVQKTVEYINYYFDDPKLRLRKRRFGLRVRIINGKRAVMTLKRPAQVKNKGIPSLKIRHEYEEEIPYKVAKALLRGRKRLSQVDVLPIQILRDLFSDSYLDKISPLGAVKTTRTIAKIPKRLEIEIDKCRVFEQRFYELEVETMSPRAADKIIRSLFEKHGIPYQPITKSKLGRFLDEWKKYRDI